MRRPLAHRAGLRRHAEPEVSEYMLHHRQRLQQGNLASKTFAAVSHRVGVDIDFRKTPQPCPDADGRAALEQHFAGPLDDKQLDRALWKELARTWRR